MNRKIFTLLAGAFLLLVAVFSANAQSAITTMPLQLGTPVQRLNLGANDYYYLRLVGYNNDLAREAMYYIALSLIRKKDYDLALRYLYKCDEGSRALDKGKKTSSWMVMSNL